MRAPGARRPRNSAANPRCGSPRRCRGVFSSRAERCIELPARRPLLRCRARRRTACAASDLRCEARAFRDESLRDQRSAADPHLASQVAATTHRIRSRPTFRRPGRRCRRRCGVARALALCALVDVVLERLLLGQMQGRWLPSRLPGRSVRQGKCERLHRRPPDWLTPPTLVVSTGRVVGVRARPGATQVTSRCDLRWMPRRSLLVYRQRMQFAGALPRRVPPRVADLALALTLFAVAQAEVWTPFNTSLGRGSSAVAAALGTVMTLPLALRRLAPLAAGTLIVVPTPVVAAFTPVRLLFFGGFLPLIVVTYTLASRGRTPRALTAVALPFAALLAAELEVQPFARPAKSSSIGSGSASLRPSASSSARARCAQRRQESRVASARARTRRRTARGAGAHRARAARRDRSFASA